MLKVTTLVAIFSSLSLLALGTDGVVCVLMTFPVAVPLALLGGIIAHWVNTAIRSSGRSRGVAVALFPPLWLAMAVEPSVIGPPDLQAVSSVVEIKADATRVWRNVVAFPPINASVGLVFRLGIAYPTSATISGEGVGAIRRCNFSTGAFVEPITRWLPGHELAFSVVASPPPMTETSFYSNLKVPHLSHTFESERGRFLLTATDHGTVLLEGTTWYRQRLWPQFYWNGVADLVIHKIHERVLGHIKRSAERS